LYVVIDKKVCGSRKLFAIVNKIKNQGIGLIQLRDKISNKEIALRDAFRLRRLLWGTRPASLRPLFIVNDHLDIAKIVDSDGIHLGQDDLPIGIARKLLGKDKIVGISCHNLKQALLAQEKGADYISIGPLFSTPTKPEYKPIGLEIIKKAREKIKIPFFVIGGINKGNLKQVKSCGGKRVALCRAVCRCRNIADTLNNLKSLIR
jgi:thiamine-phosphate pyrophosphorylase